MLAGNISKPVMSRNSRRNSFRYSSANRPKPKPSVKPSTATTKLCAKNTCMICPPVAPRALSVPISGVRCTTNVICELVMPNAATIITKNSRKNITLRSTFSASRICVFSSSQVVTT